MINSSKILCPLYFILLVLAAWSPAGAGELNTHDDKAYMVALAKPLDPYPDTGGYSLLLMAVMGFKYDPTLYRQPSKGERSKTGAIEQWRDTVYAKLTDLYPVPREDRADYCFGPECPAPYENPLNTRKEISRVVSKETFLFMRQHMPVLDKLITSLRLEVSEKASKDDPSPVFKDMYRTPEFEHKNPDQSNLKLQGRLRIKADEGSLGVIGETNASFRKITSYFSLNLKTMNETSFGVKYLLAKNTHILLERETRYAASIKPLSYHLGQERMSQNAVRVVFYF